MDKTGFVSATHATIRTLHSPARVVREVKARSLFASMIFFFFNDTATTEIYTLSLHDALPIYHPRHDTVAPGSRLGPLIPDEDRKSTRLNSSHTVSSYAVFCLKKKKRTQLATAQVTEKQTDHQHTPTASER